MSRTLTAADRSALIRLASTMGPGSPERRSILAGLEKSASRMGVDIFRSFVEPKKYIATRRNLANDKQSQDLLRQIQTELLDRLTPDDSTERALNRLSNLLSGSQDPANLRNQIFKVANELGIRLPSGMF
jgi:hypothetical protein